MQVILLNVNYEVAQFEKSLLVVLQNLNVMKNTKVDCYHLHKKLVAN